MCRSRIPYFNVYVLVWEVCVGLRSKFWFIAVYVCAVMVVSLRVLCGVCVLVDISIPQHPHGPWIDGSVVDLDKHLVRQNRGFGVIVAQGEH